MLIILLSSKHLKNKLFKFCHILVYVRELDFNFHNLLLLENWDICLSLVSWVLPTFSKILRKKKIIVNNPEILMRYWVPLAVGKQLICLENANPLKVNDTLTIFSSFCLFVCLFNFSCFQLFILPFTWKNKSAISRL